MARRAIRLLLPLLLVLPHAAFADEVPARTRRLVALGRLWGQVRIFHPWLAYRDLDWDGAVLAAIPRVAAARGAAELAAAARDLVAPLGDPLTRLAPARTPGAPSATDPQPHFRADGDVLVVSLTNHADLLQALMTQRDPGALVAAIGKHARVVFDLRERVLAPQSGMASAYVDWIGLRMLPARVALPVDRVREHHGFPSPASSGGYSTGFRVSTPPALAPLAPRPDARFAFVVEGHQPLPALALGLEHAGLAAIVVEGSARNLDTSATTLVDLGEGVRVEYRLGELVYPDGGAGPRVTREVTPRAGKDVAMEAALRWLRGKDRDKGARKAPAPLPMPTRPLDEPAAGGPAYPDLPHRIFAAFRLWSVLHYFFPYHRYTDRAWDDALARHLPAFEAARDAREYAAAVARMAAELDDGHVGVAGPGWRELVGGAAPPLSARMIDGRAVVVTVEPAAAAAGVRVGDVIERIDGEPLAARMARLRPLLGASTPDARALRILRNALLGPEGQGSLTLSDGKASREVRLARAPLKYPVWRDGEVVRLLPGNVGYVDLDRLEAAAVPAALQRLKATRAIVFDMRGYPHQTAWALAPLLARKPGAPAAQFLQPLVHPHQGATTWTGFLQTIPPGPPSPVYTGKTVMLVDERTQSQAEHTGLFLEAAAGTVFVGSPSSGANGDVTSVSLPGGLSVSFTGQEVKFVDGRQLQRRGIQPQVPVRPTLAGVRAGKDEVLARALEYLDKGK